MPYKGASDQSEKRRWSRLGGDSYMFSVRIKEPLLSDFKEFCEKSGMIPADVMRCALRAYMDEKVRRKAKRQIREIEGKI